MSIRGAYTLVVLVGAVLMVAAAGCGGATPPASPPPTSPARAPLPPRPVEIRIDGVNPCALLTTDQKREFDIASGSPVVHNSGPIQGPACLWLTFSDHPDQSWTGGAVLNHGAEYGLGNEPVRSIRGFSATTISSLGADPNYYCGVLVDVAPGQALDANYGNESHDVPGMNREMACENAMRLASAMLATLRTIERR